MNSIYKNEFAARTLCTAFRAAVSFIVLIAVIALAPAGGQTTITPTSSTMQIAGTPDPVNPVTAPMGGTVLYGTAISPVTNLPVRHLWVADSFFGICRVDPDLDSPGPYAINTDICPLNVLPSVIGGPMAFDSSNNLLYFVDDQVKNSKGVFRINYHPEADSGNGSLDVQSVFSMAGAPSGSLFTGGQTGCPLPGLSGVPNSATIDSLGNLSVGVGRTPSILRFNKPAAATSTNFGSCSQFVQIAATGFGQHFTTGISFVGHDLWASTLEIVFVIKNADSICLVGQNPACGSSNGTAVLALPTVIGATTMVSDQVYPAINGNNLYIGDGNTVVWVGNVAAGSAGQTLASTYIDPATGLANVGAVVIDGTDPANLVIYAGDDPSGVATVGAGRIFQTTQTSAAPAAPGAPLDIVASIANGQGSVSWSPAQVAQPVTSYTVHNSFASNGLPLADILISPSGSGFPATSTPLSGIAANTGYQFQVTASNAQGSSAASASSNLAPTIPIPDPPTGVQGIAGDTQAYVSWTAPLNNGGVAITSYTVTALINNVPTPITLTVPATGALAAQLSQD